MKHIAIKLRKFEAFLKAEAENYLTNGYEHFVVEGNAINEVLDDFRTFFKDELEEYKQLTDKNDKEKEKWMINIFVC